MNKLLVAIFDDETRAGSGLTALRTLHDAGDITVYATGVIARDAGGVVSLRKPVDAGPTGTLTGLAVGSLIGLLGGPAGVAIGAVTGTLAGAVRDYWAAGVGLDFIEEAGRHLQPGKVALVAEIEEEWVIPTDTALAAIGGQVFRRARSDVLESRFDHEVAAFKAEIKELESEASHAGGVAQASLQTQLASAKTGLDGALHSVQHRVETLKHEADAKGVALESQLRLVKGDVKTRISDRLKRVKGAYHARGAKLSQAWSLAREALSV